MISKEAKSIYDKKRYRSKRVVALGDAYCPACDILLRSRFGAYGTRRFCRSCRDSGVYKSVLNREYYKKNRKRILCRVSGKQ